MSAPRAVARDAVVRIEDGGITGPYFFDHVRANRRPLLSSPKGQTTTLPPDLARKIARENALRIYRLGVPAR